MIERIMAQPIFMFTRVALSALITASAGIMMISFLYLAWTFVEDVYDALTREPIDMTNVDLYPHIQPITVTATKRPID
tara:strand:- start:222 stop:455 length:234 start_codon:yes stop_codon:yes gene_type:complete